MKTNRTSIIGMALFCTMLTWASSPVPFTAYYFETTPTGVVATLEFDSEADQLYSISRTDNLASNVWSVVVTNLPGSGTNMVYVDVAPLIPAEHFYSASSENETVELIANGGFEDPALASGSTNISASGEWVQNGSSLVIQSASWAAESGSQGVWLKGWSAGLDQFFYQDISGTGNVEYTLDAGFKFNANFESNGSTLEMALIWLDSGNTAISTNALSINDNLDASEGWKHLGITAVSPPGTASVRAWFRFTTDDTIETSSQSSALIDNISLTAGTLGASVAAEGWTSATDSAYAAAAQYAGLYALGSTDIIITDITGETVGSTSADSINGMAFTASGRQLFIAAPDSVKTYNVGTQTQSDFITGLSLGSGKTGIAHFKGELFVGTENGEILRYTAQLDDTTGSYSNSITVGDSVKAITVDIQDEMLYVATPNELYSLNPSNSVLTQLAAVSNLVDITYGRTYGAEGCGGLLLVQDNGSEHIVYRITTDELQAGGAVTLEPYYESGTAIPDMAATACGRLLTAGAAPQMLSDTNDTRMGFMEWVADEFEQNVNFAKTLCWQDGGLTGMVQNTVVKNGSSRGVVSSPDAAFWVVSQLLMSDEINGDAEARGLVREIIKRYAQLDVNTDGQWYHWYDSTTGDRTWGDVDPDGTTSIFSTMKAVHMAIRAKEYYPDDTETVAAADTIINRLRNQRDYIREFGKQKSPANDLGPTLDSVSTGIFTPYIETHLFSELMAASEPMCENAYLDYWRYRGSHTYDYTLPDEPIVRSNSAGFWRMYDQSTIAHCRESEDWQQEFENYYALFAGWTDDHAPEHLTAFSAGQVPNLDDDDPSTSYSYNADKYTSHPGTVNSFGTVIGFGLHGNTVPVVGAYFAYRDGRRQLMEGSDSIADPNLLTRISYDYPTWLLNNISPTDHQYAGYALGEILSPGSIGRAIAVHTYLEPQYDGTNVLFSKTAKRHIWGTENGTDWTSLGFHESPYTPAADALYTNYRVTGAEGELLDPVSNQTYDVSADFDSTLYIVRAVSTNTANLRVQWYNGDTYLSEQTSSELRVDAVKPSGATAMKVDLYGEAYEQISVVLDGALETFDNAGFEEEDFTDWSSTQQTGMSRSNVADSRIEGSRACEFIASVDAEDGKYTQVYHEYDISGDPTNTHYVVEFDVITENLQGSSLRARLKVFDITNSTVRAENYDTFEHADSQTMLSAGFRKRDTDHVTLRFIIRLTRDDASAVTAEERVLVDNLRLLKMKP